ncbi:hypothetical protein CEXT_136781 [Caerostris extrusa]|uniref:Uncharacterized protein n=1 Tax=Caerostris extrusa TaxID=172846 RepID=A0AAV4X5Z2_CAEEX|nr:hypothetical protein CEXT_136781 [Caerostris extrusa]
MNAIGELEFYGNIVTKPLLLNCESTSGKYLAIHKIVSSNRISESPTSSRGLETNLINPADSEKAWAGVDLLDIRFSPPAILLTRQDFRDASKCRPEENLR